MNAPDTVLFEVETPLGFRVRLTRFRWKLISRVKHPVMSGQEIKVRDVLANPDQIRQSRSDPMVFLFYQSEGSHRWVCAVAKETETSGFLITAYPTDRIKEGVKVWPK